MSQSSSKPKAAAPEPVQYVRTQAIRDAVAGRETEVLDALGIRWREGRPHINCPYPDHRGEEDWRWNDKKARAYCTCSTGDSVFDVVMKCEGLQTFDDAKLRVAEIIGAQQLVTVRHGDDRRFMRTDARSLISPPSDNRDDELVRAYLAHRLGVDLVDAPIPSTPIAGIEALDYFDPLPQGSKAKPKSIGAFPCAVFGTLSPDGRAHAHRIYLAPGGAGKAKLGQTSSGKERDPKKSAKTSDDISIGGLSVLWGDPETAATTIVLEGIETGAAVAYALRDKVAKGDVLVAAAISAVGVEAFQPWPACDLLIVGADRDEAPKGARQPSRRGEKAARKLGLRLHDKINVKIAMPGLEGEAKDWLDVFEKAGEEAVANGLRRAAAYVPTQNELEERATAHERKTECERAAEIYPLPELDLLTLRYGHTGTGRLRVFRIDTNDKGDITALPIASPFGVVARLRQLDKEETYGLRVVVQGMNGAPVTLDVGRDTVFSNAVNDLRGQLGAAGLRTEGEGGGAVISALRGAEPETEISVVSRPGWHHIEGFPTPMFMTPAGVAYGAPAKATVELGLSVRMSSAVAVGGTLEAWKTAVTAAATTPGCEHWVLGLLAGFAGALVDLTQIDTCGIDFTGMTSAGKSTAQRIAASAWSVPDSTRDKSLFQSARQTDNALEAAAARANGTVLSLDEMAHVRGREVAKIVYMIAGGTGKARMKAGGDIRPTHKWSTFALLSGEQSLEEKVTSDGEEWMGGMAVRILDIDVTAVNRTVPAETLQIINGIRTNFGHAGPAFVEHLVKGGLHRRALELRERINHVAETIAGDADAATRRAALPLAVLQVAGEIARGAGLVSPEVNIGGAIAWAWSRFLTSSNAEALSPDDQSRNALRLWIMSRWNVTIKNVTGEGGSSVREAEGWYDGDAVYIPKDRLKEAGGGASKETAVAEMLERTGGLYKRKDTKRRYVEYIPGKGPVKAYALSRQQFGQNSSADDADRPSAAVVQHGGASRSFAEPDDDLPF